MDGAAGSPRRRDRGGLEREVLAALATAGRPLTPGDVLDELGGDLAYTTVMTTLARLYDKGVLDRERSGRAYAYTPVVEAALTARQMRRLLETDTDRAGVLARFVAELGPDDERMLAALLEETLGDQTDPRG
jgi:predicted transcriptional regulator